MIHKIYSQKKNSWGFLSRLLFGGLLSLGTPAFAFEIAGGFSIVETGDDRVRPGLSLHSAINDTYGGKLHYFGQSFGPVKEETYLISANRRFSIFKSKLFFINLGVCGMNEKITLDFRDSEASQSNAGKNRIEDNYNLGGVFGVTASLPKESQPLSGGVSWESHVFPAGPNGLVFLSTGRKQTISIYLGVAL